MKEALHPQGIEERQEALRGLVRRGMLNHREEYFRKLWGADLPKQPGDPEAVLEMTGDAVAKGVAFALAPRNRTELLKETSNFITRKEQEIDEMQLMNEPEKGRLAQGLLTSLQEDLKTPASRINPEKAAMDFRTKIAQQVAQLELVTDVGFAHTIPLIEIGENDEIIFKEKSFKKLGISYAERLGFLGHLTEVAVYATLRQLQAERAAVANT